MKSKKLHNKNHKPKKKTFRLILGSLLATTLISYAGYTAVDSYYSRKIEQRRDKYNKSIMQFEKGKLMVLPKIPFNFIGKIIYVNGIERVEREFESGLEGLVNYIDSNKNQLIKLTDSDSEVRGYIGKKGNLYSIQLLPNPNTKLIQYLNELVSGDFTHKEEVLKHINLRILAFFTEDHNISHIYNSLAIIEGYYNYIKLPEDVKKATPVISLQTLLGEHGETDPQGLKEAFEDVKRKFEIFNKYLKLMAPSDITPNFFNNPNLYSTFHTHPKDCVNCGPSPPDEIDTFISVPDILFYQSNGKLHVFAIQKGSSREIYSK